MTLSAYDDPRWLAIAAADIDDPRAAFPLSARLARENGWTRAFADRVVEQYRRFCYLAVTSGREMTPSDEVDQAWHLHILYTEHYWGPWTDALGSALHHGPTQGGPAEARRYADNYQGTVELYEQAFGEKPPIDIWPLPEDRFDRPGRFQRIDTSRVLMMERAAIKPAAFLFAAVVFVTLLVADRINTVPIGDVHQAGFFQMPGDLKPLLLGGAIGGLATVLWLLLRSGGSPTKTKRNSAKEAGGAAGVAAHPPGSKGSDGGDGWGGGCGSGCGGGCGCG